MFKIIFKQSVIKEVKKNHTYFIREKKIESHFHGNDRRETRMIPVFFIGFFLTIMLTCVNIS